MGEVKGESTTGGGATSTGTLGGSGGGTSAGSGVGMTRTKVGVAVGIGVSVGQGVSVGRGVTVLVGVGGMVGNFTRRSGSVGVAVGSSNIWSISANNLAKLSGVGVAVGRGRRGDGSGTGATTGGAVCSGRDNSLRPGTRVGDADGSTTYRGRVGMGFSRAPELEVILHARPVIRRMSKG